MRIIRQTLQCDRTGRHQGRLLKAGTFVVAGVLLCFLSLRIEASAPTEYEVKAAYLCNFGRFVQWPAKAKAGNSFVICVLGADPFGKALNHMAASQTIDGLNVVTSRISNPAEAAGCHILFISSTEESDLKGILATLDSTSVLTVSDMPDFTDRGGMVQFVLKANRVHFAINLAAATRAGLRLSSQLLKLAVNLTANLRSRE